MEYLISFCLETRAKFAVFVLIWASVAVIFLSHYELFPNRPTPVLDPAAQALVELLADKQAYV